MIKVPISFSLIPLSFSHKAYFPAEAPRRLRKTISFIYLSPAPLRLCEITIFHFSPRGAEHAEKNNFIYLSFL
jgi:hypothetical protein